MILVTGMGSIGRVARSIEGKYSRINGGSNYKSVDYFNNVVVDNYGPIRTSAISGDGKYQVLSVYDSSTSCWIHVSSDYGQTFIAKLYISGSQSPKLHVSRDGQYMTAVWGTSYPTYAGAVYVSTNFGNNWVNKRDGFNRGYSAMSDNGQHIIISLGTYLEKSSDHGVTWSTKEVGDFIRSMSISDDGQKIVLGCNYLYGPKVSVDGGNNFDNKFIGYYETTYFHKANSDCSKIVTSSALYENDLYTYKIHVSSGDLTSYTLIGDFSQPFDMLDISRSGKVIMIGHTYGVKITYNEGATWIDSPYVSSLSGVSINKG